MPSSPVSPSRKRPLSTPTGLLLTLSLGFAVALGLMFTVVALGTNELAAHNAGLARIVQNNNVKSQLASRMRDALRDRAITLHLIVATRDAWERDALFLKFLNYGERYALDRTALLPLLDSAQERRLMEDLDAITRNAQPIMFDVAEDALAPGQTKLRLRAEALPLQAELVGALDRMSALQTEANTRALARSYNDFQATRQLMQTMGLLAILLTLGTSVWAGRRLYCQARTLDTERHRYQTLFEDNIDAVMLINGSRITDANPAARALFGITDDLPLATLALSRFEVGDIATPQPAHLATALNTARADGTATVEWPACRLDGENFLARARLHTLTIRGNTQVQCVIQDISALRAAEDAKDAALKASQATARAKSDFIANISHEIRTPMHGMLGMAERLMKSGIDARQREYVGMLQSSAQHLLSIIDDILDFSRIDAGRLVLASEAFSPVALIEGITGLYAAPARDKGLDLQSHIGSHAPAALVGDATRIRQVLLNLTDNAVKFCERGEINIEAEFVVHDTEVDCEFRVSDTGIGLSETTRQRLFNAFSQGDTSTTRRHGGTGLGLAVSHQLARLMGGQLSASNRPEGGSTFTLSVCLPMTTMTPDPATPPPLPQLAGHVLVVEDHPVNQAVLGFQLEELGLRFSVVETGRAALEKLATETFDLVLMDWQMPEMDGLEATRRIRSELGLTVPIIAVTANASEGFRQTCLDAGANDYLGKPYSDAALASLLAYWLTPADQRPPRVDAATLLFDRSALAARYPGNPELLAQLTEMFHSTSLQSLASLRPLIAVRDTAHVMREAHQLRGAAASVLATAVQQHATDLEHQARDGHWDAAEASFAALYQLFQPERPDDGHTL